MGDTTWRPRGLGPALCFAWALNATACAITTSARSSVDADTADHLDGAVDASLDVAAADAPDDVGDVIDRDVPLTLDVAPLAPTDAPAVDPCERLVDLNARGTVMGDTLVWTADGPATAERAPTPLPGDRGGTTDGLGFVTALRYTAPFDGVVRITARSLARVQPVSLLLRFVTACARDAQVLAETIVSEAGEVRSMRAGESFVVLVGARFPLPPSVDPYGPFEVRVRATPPAAEGARCQRGDLACATGLACSAYLGTCRSAGGLGLPCLPGGRCNAEGLACSGHDTCERALALGDACGSIYTACPEQAGCVGGTRCVAVGARGGWCRSAAPWCDAGLSCEFSRCNPSRAVGEACDASYACVEGAHCVFVAGASRCVRDGELGGWCNVRLLSCGSGQCSDSLRTCSDGLACSWRLNLRQCRPAVPLGGRCDDTEATSVCADGSCVGGVCVRDGALNATCRETATPCDDGLGCVGVTHKICRPIVALGAPCARGACARGSTCQPAESADARCVADGASGGRARPFAPVCDAGLSRASTGLCLPTAPAGATCNATRPTAACVEGTSCVGSRCVPIGSPGGECRETAPRCDRATICSSRDPTEGGSCLTELAVGAPCPSGAGLCTVGSTCLFSTDADRCVRDGQLGARCRDVAPLCDEGMCDLSVLRCVRPLPMGSVCYEHSISAACAIGSSCVGATSGDRRCTPDGVDGGRCRAASPSCDAGLRCSGPALAEASRCVR